LASANSVTSYLLGEIEAEDGDGLFEVCVKGIETFIQQVRVFSSQR
jgi:hypothetical protein